MYWCAVKNHFDYGVITVQYSTLGRQGCHMAQTMLSHMISPGYRHSHLYKRAELGNMTILKKHLWVSDKEV